MNPTINAQNLRAGDIKEAYDILHAEIANDDSLVESGKDAKETAICLLERKLTEVGYKQAAHAAQICETHLRELKNKKLEPKSACDASENARLLTGAILGKTFEAAKPKAASGKSTATPETRDEAENIAVDLDSIAFDAPQLVRINGLIGKATGRNDIDIESLIDLIRKTRATGKDISDAITLGNKKIDAYKNGEIEEANKIVVSSIQFQPSGLAGIKMDEVLVDSLDFMLQTDSGISNLSFPGLLIELENAEENTAKLAGDLRETIRNIHTAKPKTFTRSASPEASGEDIPFTVVMKNAKEIFVDAFGQTSEMLDFEVPTLEFAEPHPDVPEINPTFRFYAPILADGLDSINENDIPWLYGDSGCGKSEFVEQLAARLGYPFYRLNMDSHLSRGDLVGLNRLVRGEDGSTEMRFVEGLVPRALKTPSILLIDEMDLGDPEIMPVLQPVLEGKGIRLLEDGGRYVRPHPLMRIFATGNTIGLGSEDMTYLNVHEQSAATRDRIGRYIQMLYLPEDMETQVVLESIPHADKNFVEQIVKFANRMREARRLNQISQVISTRAVKKAAARHANYVKRYPTPDMAERTTVETVILNRCDAASRAVAEGFVDNIFNWRTD